ncbi:MAG: dihydropteroate synthase [Bacteroidota bacterium]
MQTFQTLNLNGKLLDLSIPKVMGILNVTPDSFFSGSRVESERVILEQVEKMLSEGAAILDVGGYSTRPDASDIPVEEEISRIRPAIKAIKRAFPTAIVSIDTFRSEVARVAVSEGATIINDVSGGNLDEKMFQTVADLGVLYILMHMRGTPQTMKTLNQYEDLIGDIVDELQKKIYKLNVLGVTDIIIDPGFGFAKNIPQNFKLLRHMQSLSILERPILAGVSRKSMIYKTLDTDPTQALNGTTALNMVALQNGAKILRVHDVKEAVETVTLFGQLTKV